MRVLSPLIFSPCTVCTYGGEGKPGQNVYASQVVAPQSSLFAEETYYVGTA